MWDVLVRATKLFQRSSAPASMLHYFRALPVCDPCLPHAYLYQSHSHPRPCPRPPPPLTQTILDACVSAILFYTVGFAFAYGESANPNTFIGNAAFAASN